MVRDWQGIVSSVAICQKDGGNPFQSKFIKKTLAKVGEKRSIGKFNINGRLYSRNVTRDIVKCRNMPKNMAEININKN